jgi:hypothetical protein
MNGWGEINQAGGLMNGSYLYRHTTITTGWLVGWLVSAGIIMAHVYLSHIPSP